MSKKKSCSTNLYKKHLIPNTGVGVAFSGGGSRALSSTMGQLRGLKHLNLLDKVSCISAVSGGTWASSLYTYLPDSISDDDFLGPVVEDPGKLVWETEKYDPNALNHHTPNNLGQVPTQLGLVKMAVRAGELYLGPDKVPATQLWQRLIGEYVFKPFNLFDAENPKYFSESEDWVNSKITPNNTSLTVDQFHIPKLGRPPLIVNFNLAPLPDNKFLIPMESTGIMTGILKSYTDQGANGQDIGGGYIDPFAFGSSNPKLESDGRVTTNIPPRRFSLHEMAGLSSAAFAETLQGSPDLSKEIKSIIPTQNYWPVEDLKQPALDYHFADGGNLEDTGIAALLRRKLDTIIVFVNGEQPLEYDNGNKEVVVGEQVSTLFGFQPKKYNKITKKWSKYEPFPSGSSDTMAQNKVFSAPDFFALLSALWNSNKVGGTAMSVQMDIDVLDQPHLGVKKYKTKKILWVYNTEVTEWKVKLDSKIQKKINERFLGGTWNFPNFETMSQLRLDTIEVNLLAHLSCWNIISENTVGNPKEEKNNKIFTDMFN